MRLVWLLIDAVIAVTIVAAFLAFVGPSHWWLDLFTQFRPQYVILLGIGTVLLAFRRLWMVVAVAAVAFIANIAVLFGHATLAEVQQGVPAGTPKLRCVTLNVLQGNRRFAAIENFLKKSDADVVVMQEVTPDYAELFEGLAEQFPHRHLRGRKDSKGAAILSRRPVRRLDFEPFPGQDQIGAVVGEIEGDTPFTVFGIHSHKPTSADGAQSQGAFFDWLADRCREETAKDRPVVLLGDFNATPWATKFRRFATRTNLQDTSRGVLFGATWNVLLPHRLLIDHAFVSPDWRVVRREIGPDVGSDHRPLIVDLALTE